MLENFSSASSRFALVLVKKSFQVSFPTLLGCLQANTTATCWEFNCGNWWHKWAFIKTKSMTKKSKVFFSCVILPLIDRQTATRWSCKDSVGLLHSAPSRSRTHPKQSCKPEEHATCITDHCVLSALTHFSADRKAHLSTLAQREDSGKGQDNKDLKF